MKNTYTLNIYTDGACSGNPGNGGTGHVIVMDGVNCLESNNEGYVRTTNNRMEILAVVKGLKSAKRYIDTTLLGDLHKDRDIDIKINVYSDSQLVVNTMTQGWARKSNKDLWEQLDAALARFEAHEIKCTFNKVKGHAFDRWNNLADELAVKASQNPILHDEVYENIWWLTPSVRPCVEPVPKPEIVEIRFCNVNDKQNRRMEILLTNGTVVKIIPTCAGFAQTECTTAEAYVTEKIAWKYVGWLNGHTDL